MKEKLTVENSGFRADQKIEMTGEQFSIISVGLDEIMNGHLELAYPLQFDWIDLNDEPVETPTEEDVKSGKIRRVLSPFKTFNPDNAVESYVRVPMITLEALRKKAEVHQKEIDAGRAVSGETLMAEHNAKLETLKVETVGK